jgi:hypothetical protein
MSTTGSIILSANVLFYPRDHEEAVRGASRPEDVALRRVSGWRSIEETITTVAAVLAIPRASLMERRRVSLARAAAAWALVRHAGLTQRGAAAALGMSTGAVVSQQLTRWETVVSRAQSWQAIVAELDQRLARANY